MNQNSAQQLLNKTSRFIFLGLLAYMPLHIFLSTWIGTSFGILEFTKVFKDIVLIIGFFLVLLASIKQIWLRQLLKEKIVWLIASYCALNIVYAILKKTDQDAEILGIVYGTRFFIFFLYGMLLAQLYDAKKLLKQAITVVMVVALIVLLFGVVQYILLPNDALTHVGYQRSTGVLPAFFIDDKPDLERVMSTLRDPNSFGSYIIIVGILAFAVLGIKQKKQYIKLPKISVRNINLVATCFHILVLLCLWFTFSRSAWIGFLAATGVYIVLGKNIIRQYISKKVLIVGSFLLLALATSLYSSRNTYFMQNVILHKDNSTVLEDPNQLRVRFWQESLDYIKQNPLGYGPGTAGLASIRNNVQGTVLTENYYLQILHELGVIGLALFLTIGLLVANKLFDKRNNTIALALLASFTGLAITNFLVHIWANEAVAYTWWGLAGVLIALNQPTKHKNTTIKN